MTSQGLKKMIEKFEASILFSVASESGKKPSSLVTEKAVVLSVKEATMEVHSQWKPHTHVEWTYYVVRCTKLSLNCCSSTHTKSNIFKYFKVTILLLKNLSLWNSLHGQKWINIVHETFCACRQSVSISGYYSNLLKFARVRFTEISSNVKTSIVKLSQAIMFTYILCALVFFKNIFRIINF